MSAIFVIICLIAMLCIELAYIPIARRKGWTAPQCSRSGSRLPDAVVGGGIIFYIGMVIWSLGMVWVYNENAPSAYFLTGLTMLAATSFADDLMCLYVWFRLLVQFVAVAFLCFEFHVLAFPAWIVLLYMTAAVGFVNGYNFMDGINGMTAAYSVVVLGVLFYVDTCTGTTFTSGSLIATALGSAAIFGFFNFRRRAAVFAGDVGSISMGFIVTMLLTKLLLATGNIYALVFVGVYAADIFLTILRRLIEGDNIFRPHRKHIYERLHFVWGIPQLLISSAYALLQLAISAGYLAMRTATAQKEYFFTTVVLLTVLYVVMMLITGRPLRCHRAER